VLDIRTREEFCQGHICGATNIPTPLPPLSTQQHRQLQARLQKFLRHNPVDAVVVYCKKGIRAAEAACQLLRNFGLVVMNIGGVMDEPLKSVMSGKINTTEIRRCVC